MTTGVMAVGVAIGDDSTVGVGVTVGVAVGKAVGTMGVADGGKGVLVGGANVGGYNNGWVAVGITTGNFGSGVAVGSGTYGSNVGGTSALDTITTTGCGVAVCTTTRLGVDVTMMIVAPGTGSPVTEGAAEPATDVPLACAWFVAALATVLAAETVLALACADDDPAWLVAAPLPCVPVFVVLPVFPGHDNANNPHSNPKIKMPSVPNSICQRQRNGLRVVFACELLIALTALFVLTGCAET